MSDHLGENPSWCKTTLVKTHPDDARPPWWKPSLMQDHLGENRAWCKTTMVKNQPDARSQWWRKPTLMQDHPSEENPPWCKITLVMKPMLMQDPPGEETHPDQWKTTLMRDSESLLSPKLIWHVHLKPVKVKSFPLNINTYSTAKQLNASHCHTVRQLIFDKIDLILST